ncbi:MAG: alpha/beta hydrolase [Desulfobacterales bacterium]|nr:alpha/beta hydrolase [Desulfobacterales bacterium]
MRNVRKYGKAPFCVVVVHGGPGAAGEMARPARELAARRGVLEPLQTATSVDGQVEELREVLEKNGELPAALIGFSWGAWLSFIFAARHPEFVRKLILVGSGPYEEKYAAGIQEIRIARLDEAGRKEVDFLIGFLDDPGAEVQNRAFGRLGKLFSSADAYEPTAAGSGTPQCRYDIFQSVWGEAEELRRSGKLLALGEHIQCPVTAIHGDYDPHPAEGVRKPLSAVLKEFTFILLKKCGHTPWMERNAREAFFKILEEELPR